MVWLKRFIFASVPVIALTVFLGGVPWLIAGSYYLSLWIVFWSKDNAGSVPGGGHPDQLGGPF